MKAQTNTKNPIKDKNVEKTHNQLMALAAAKLGWEWPRFNKDNSILLEEGEEYIGIVSQNFIYVTSTYEKRYYTGDTILVVTGSYSIDSVKIICNKKQFEEFVNQVFSNAPEDAELVGFCRDRLRYYKEVVEGSYMLKGALWKNWQKSKGSPTTNILVPLPKKGKSGNCVPESYKYTITDKVNRWNSSSTGKRYYFYINGEHELVTLHLYSASHLPEYTVETTVTPVHSKEYQRKLDLVQSLENIIKNSTQKLQRIKAELAVMTKTK